VSDNVRLYLSAVAISFALSFAATPLIRLLAVRMGWLDTPTTDVKTHTVAVPALGGVGIWVGFAGALVAMRFLTHFPTGTLFRLRAILAGGALVFLMGIADDLQKPHGLDWKTKMAVQAAAAGLLIHYGIHLRFIQPQYLAVGLTLFWVVGVCNAFNIVDIMDGLASSQAAAAAMGFLFIALPSEEIYVNFAAAALMGAAFGFIPWNITKRWKIFMGDSGSLLLGFVLAALALGTDYTQVNPLGVYAPLFILAIPIFDTLFVMVVRMRKKRSPFEGSKDHFALRLEKIGVSRPAIVAICLGVSVVLSACALTVTLVSTPWALAVYAAAGALLLAVAWWLTQVDMQ